MRPADVVLHPARMRIVQAFLGDRELTTGDLRVEIPDVPSATLYRQVAALAQGGVLDVVEEKRVRGAVERTYRLRTGAAHVDAEEARQMTVEEHRRVFLTFAVGLLADFDRYLDRGDVDMARDHAGFTQTAMYLTDEEMSEVVDELRAVLHPGSPFRRRQAAPGGCSPPSSCPTPPGRPPAQPATPDRDHPRRSEHHEHPPDEALAEDGETVMSGTSPEEEV